MSYTGIPGLSKGKAPREVKEEDLLNDIEASTKRLYQQVHISLIFIHYWLVSSSNYCAPSFTINTQLLLFLHVSSSHDTLTKNQRHTSTCWKKQKQKCPPRH